MWINWNGNEIWYFLQVTSGEQTSWLPVSVCRYSRGYTYSKRGYTYSERGVHFTQGGTLNGRPILTHGVSTSWTNKISQRRGTGTQELAPVRPSDSKQKPHKCHSMVKFQDIGRQLQILSTKWWSNDGYVSSSNWPWNFWASNCATQKIINRTN